MKGYGRDAADMALEGIEDEPNNYRLTPPDDDGAWDMIDQTAVLTHVNREGIEVLEYWQYYPNAEKILVDVLERTNKELEQVMSDDWIALYEGTYKDGQGKRWTFGKYTLKRDGDARPQPVTVQKSYDTPTYVIAVGDQYFEMIPTLQGWDAYPCRPVYDDGVTWERTGKAVVLKWADPTRGRFHIASEHILNARMIHCFDKNALRLMRNEIMARHHYPFQGNEMKAYFGSQSWYKPQAGATSPKLSYIEELNVKLIQNAESIDDREYYHLMETE